MKTISDLNIESVSFEYPNRPEVKVLDNLTLEIKQGQKVAFVGGSGCGKSTIIQLVERFYDPCSGNIRLGANNLKELDLTFVRSKMSIVSQEPVLFDITIGICKSQLFNTLFFCIISNRILLNKRKILHMETIQEMLN